MHDDPPFRPADPADVLYTLSYGLRFSPTGKPHRLAIELAARLAAEMLMLHLDQSGFVVMRKPPPPSLDQMVAPKE